MTLDDQMLALMKRHDLHSLEVGFIIGSDGEPFPVVHVAGGGETAVGSYSAPNLSDCLKGAIDKLNDERFAALADLPPLTVEAAE